MARRTVMNESWKWRSGRDGLRVVPSCLFGRGGKKAATLGDDKREAAQRDRNVMVPAAKTPTLKGVEAELPLDVLVHALAAPALFDEASDLLLAGLHRRVGVDEAVLRRALLARLPLQ